LPPIRNRNSNMSRDLPPRLQQYTGLRRGRRTLRLLAPLLQLGIVGLGLAIFLDQSRSLLSDAQFTWGERSVMGVVALVALGGSALAAWVVGLLIGIAAEMFDAMADVAESARRTTELIEGHVVPTLVRIATALEPSGSDRERTEPARHRPAKP
jgi:hypothetical protein